LATKMQPCSLESLAFTGDSLIMNTAEFCRLVATELHLIVGGARGLNCDRAGSPPRLRSLILRTDSYRHEIGAQYGCAPPTVKL
jgi:hypothetical protein